MSLLRSLQPLILPVKTGAARFAREKAETEGIYRLEFNIQRQEYPYWCWAAVTSSVSQFFNKDSLWTQCKVASACKESSCCGSDAAPKCYQPHYLQDALNRAGHLAECFNGAES